MGSFHAWDPPLVLKAEERVLTQTGDAVAAAAMLSLHLLLVVEKKDTNETCIGRKKKNHPHPDFLFLSGIWQK